MRIVPRGCPALNALRVVWRSDANRREPSLAERRLEPTRNDNHPWTRMSRR